MAAKKRSPKKRAPLTGVTSDAGALGKHGVTKGGRANQPTPKAPKASGGRDMKYMQTRINSAGWRELKMLALTEGRSLQSIVVDSLNDALRKHGRAPVVTGPSEDNPKD